MKRELRIKILDEANAVLIGLNPSHQEWFYEHYGKRTESYFFDKRYKLGQWDGKIHFFSKTGKTYVALLPYIIQVLKNIGTYKLKLEDYRKDGVQVDNINENHFSHIINPLTEEPFILRYYQVEAINALIDEGGGVCIAGTGAGKTIIAAALVEQYSKKRLKSIIIVPSEDLIIQTKNDFIMWGLDTGEYSGSEKSINHEHVISTWQALQHNPTIMNNFDVVVVDEAHGLRGKVLQELLTKYGKNIRYRFGLTGTLPKAEVEAMSVKVSVGEVKYEIPAHQLINEGFLSNMEINIYQLKENFIEEYEKAKEYNSEVANMTYKQFKNNYIFNSWTDEKRYLQSYEHRLDWIAHCIKALSEKKKGNVLCLINGISFGKKVTDMIPGAAFVHGKDKGKVRKEIYDMFGMHDNLTILASMQIASTGLNIPRIFNLVFVDIGKSYIRVMQSIGRGLRKAEDKNFVGIVDICSDLKYSKTHLYKRIKYYKEANYKYKKHIVKYDE